MKPAGILLVFLLVTLNIFSQEHNEFLDSLEAKLKKYCSLYPWEEVYIHTDREEYIAGENIWFESYLIDRESNLLSNENSILYFEILNNNNMPVIQKRIKINKGSGPGQVVLPDTLSSGIYTIRSYTGWMKNFMPANCYLGEIHIYNALDVKDVHTVRNDKDRPDARDSEKSVISRQTGYDIKVNYQNQDNIELHISCDRNTLKESNTHCYLIIQTHGNIDFKKSVILTEGHGILNIPGNILTPGINQIILFSQTGKPVVEKYIYTPAVEMNHPEVKSKGVVNTREKVQVLINDDRFTGHDTGMLSISVSADTTDSDIDHYLIFGSEFGVIPDLLYKSDLRTIPHESLDKYLSVIRSRWINWDSILTGNYPEIRYEKEKKFHFLYGRLISRLSQEPLNNEYVFLSTPSKDAIFQYARTNQYGDFFFSIPVNEEVNDLIIQPEIDGRDKSIRLRSSFAEPDSGLITQNAVSPYDPSSLVSSMAVNYQIRKIYGIKDATEPSQEKVIPVPVKRFYGRPDIELIMDDYIKLPVMQEVFFELTPGVILRKKKSVWEMKLLDPATNRLQDAPSVMLVDGVVIDDASIIAGLDPDIVEKIEVVKEKYYIGDYLFYGIINVITRTGDFSSVTLPDYALRISYKVLDKILDFKSPEYASTTKEINRIPDFRNTLYWNPSLKPGNDGKFGFEFWSSDFRSGYVIKLQGITPEGIPVSYIRNISVK
jgi:hypothetical protein